MDGNEAVDAGAVDHVVVIDDAAVFLDQQSHPELLQLAQNLGGASAGEFEAHARVHQLSRRVDHVDVRHGGACCRFCGVRSSTVKY